MLKLDGLEGACIGSVSLPDGQHLVYSVKGILDVLELRDGMTEEGAVEFYEYNILRTVDCLVNDPQRPLLMVDKELFESLDDFADRILER